MALRRGGERNRKKSLYVEKSENLVEPKKMKWYNFHIKAFW